MGAFKIVVRAGAAAAVMAATDQVVGRLASLVEGDAKKIVPVDTGDLRSSIRTEHVLVGVYQIGSDMPYAAAVENGRPDLPNYPVQPYLKPALYKRRVL